LKTGLRTRRGDRDVLTLFGNLDSGNVHKVQMILARIGEPYRRVDVAQTRNEPRDEHFLAINPMGKVAAVLRQDGRMMTESGAILYYFSAAMAPSRPFASRITSTHDGERG
jgi:glutathione S-transferase